MPERNCVSHDVIELVNRIISKQNLQSIHNIEYRPGSSVGDGYTSQTMVVNIETPKGTFELFLKCGFNIESTGNMQMGKLYANEIYFYDVVYPKYLKFLRDRAVKNGFRQAPKCYGTSEKNIVALENLRARGYTLFEKTTLMNDDHITLALKTFAKFHAISFALKDQDRENYEKLVEGTFDFFSDRKGGNLLSNLIRGTTKDLLSKLDPLQDKNLIEKINIEEFASWSSHADENLNEYSILTQGDCWCSNMMFLYQENNKNIPIDIMLIDWQVLRPASPVYDISYFFYSVASEETLAKTNDYLKVYHNELSEQIREMGSDPEALYPFRVLEREWKEYCKFGFVMAILIVKGMLSAEDEVIDLGKMDFEDKERMDNLYPKFEKEDEYLSRIRVLGNFLIKNGYL